MTTSKTKPHHSEDAHAAGLYRAMALRFYCRYIDMRGYAQFCGGDIPDHGPLPSEADAVDQYEAAASEWCLYQKPDSAVAALALIEFAGTIAADKIAGEITREGALIDDEKDALHQVIALASAGGWLNENVVLKDWLNRIRREEHKGGGDTRA